MPHTAPEKSLWDVAKLQYGVGFMQRELNRWSQFSEQKLRFFSKAFNKKMLDI